MSNTHGQPDTLFEAAARDFDLLPAAVVSTTWPAVPVSSLTFAPFATRAYVRDPTNSLIYVDQPAVSLTLPSANGTYWLAVDKDTYSPITSWTRRAGSHYLFIQSASDPGSPPGALMFAQVTVAGSIITAVTPLNTLLSTWRSWLQLGSLAGYNYVEGIASLGCTGFGATSPTGTAAYTAVGNLVTLQMPDLSGTSNHTSFGIFGLPAALSSPRALRTAVMVQDNGIFKSGYMQLNGTTISVFPDAAFGNWVASGTKASYGGTFVYRTTS